MDFIKKNPAVSAMFASAVILLALFRAFFIPVKLSTERL